MFVEENPTTDWVNAPLWQWDITDHHPQNQHSYEDVKPAPEEYISPRPLPSAPDVRNPTIRLTRLTEEEIAFHVGKRGEAGAGVTKAIKGESADMIAPSSTDSAPDELVEEVDNFIFELPCNFCGLPFISRKYLEIHEERDHGTKNPDDLEAIHVRCYICGKPYKSKYILKTHIEKVHVRDAVHGCRKCGKTFARHSLLAKHWKRLHDVAPAAGTSSSTTHVVPASSFSSTSSSSSSSTPSSSSSTSIVLAPPSDTFVCGDCGSSAFASEDEFFDHVQTYHNVDVDSILSREEEEEVAERRRMNEELQLRVMCGQDCIVRKGLLHRTSEKKRGRPRRKRLSRGGNGSYDDESVGEATSSSLTFGEATSSSSTFGEARSSSLTCGKATSSSLTCGEATSSSWTRSTDNQFDSFLSTDGLDSTETPVIKTEVAAVSPSIFNHCPSVMGPSLVASLPPSSLPSASAGPPTFTSIKGLLKNMIDRHDDSGPAFSWNNVSPSDSQLTDPAKSPTGFWHTTELQGAEIMLNLVSAPRGTTVASSSLDGPTQYKLSII